MLPNKPLTNALATVRAHGLSESTKGTPCVWVDFVFDAEKGPNGEEVSIKYFGYLTDKNMPYVLKALRALRWAGQSVMDLDGTVDNSLVGQKAYLTTDMEEYNGKFTAKVKFINETEFVANKPIPEQVKRKLAAQFDAQIAQFHSENPVPKAAAVADDDDVPF